MHALTPTLRPTAAARRLAAQLALFALLLGALLPSVSRLLQAGTASEWAVLCQSPAAAGTPAGGSNDLRHGDACALCSLAHTTPVLAGATPAALAVLAYAPPAPPALAPVRARATQARPPGARAPPTIA